jgi:hypothetical protein
MEKHPTQTTEPLQVPSAAPITDSDSESSLSVIKETRKLVMPILAQEDTSLQQLSPITFSELTPADVFASVDRKDLMFSVWDFGGQLVFQTVQHLFMTRTGVYRKLLAYKTITFSHHFFSNSCDYHDDNPYSFLKETQTEFQAYPWMELVSHLTLSQHSLKSFVDLSVQSLDTQNLLFCMVWYSSFSTIDCRLISYLYQQLSRLL